jgi:hypothetical protein
MSCKILVGRWQSQLQFERKCVSSATTGLTAPFEFYFKRPNRVCLEIRAIGRNRD